MCVHRLCTCRAYRAICTGSKRRRPKADPDCGVLTQTARLKGWPGLGPPLAGRRAVLCRPTENDAAIPEDVWENSFSVIGGFTPGFCVGCVGMGGGYIPRASAVECG